MHQNKKTKKYVIVNNVIDMGQKVVITNLAEDDEGSYFVYITRRMASKNGLQKRRKRESAAPRRRKNQPKNKGPNAQRTLKNLC